MLPGARLEMLGENSTVVGRKCDIFYSAGVTKEPFLSFVSTAFLKRAWSMLS